METNRTGRYTKRDHCGGGLRGNGKDGAVSRRFPYGRENRNDVHGRNGIPLTLPTPDLYHDDGCRSRVCGTDTICDIDISIGRDFYRTGAIIIRPKNRTTTQTTVVPRAPFSSPRWNDRFEYIRPGMFRFVIRSRVVPVTRKREYDRSANGKTTSGRFSIIIRRARFLFPALCEPTRRRTVLRGHFHFPNACPGRRPTFPAHAVPVAVVRAPSTAGVCSGRRTTRVTTRTYIYYADVTQRARRFADYERSRVYAGHGTRARAMLSCFCTTVYAENAR